MRFDRSMDESNTLYREEQNAMVLARRLQEQNEYSAGDAAAYRHAR